MAKWADLASWVGPTSNQGGAMVEVRGVVLHIAEGGYAGTIAWQKNPTSDVSSHFIAAKDGRAAQMVDTNVTAWTQKAGNGHWLSIENEGFVPDKLTAGQVEFAAQILARAHAVYGVPLQVTANPNGRGLGHHSMGANPGSPDDWGHSSCPGQNIIDQKPAIVARAKEIIEGDDVSDLFPKLGDKGEPVKYLQRRLRDLGYLGATAAIDGIYDAQLAGVVKKYRTERLDPADVGTGNAISGWMVNSMDVELARKRSPKGDPGPAGADGAPGKDGVPQPGQTFSASMVVQ